MSQLRNPAVKATNTVEEQQDNLPDLLRDICHGIEEYSKEEGQSSEQKALSLDKGSPFRRPSL